MQRVRAPILAVLLALGGLILDGALPARPAFAQQGDPPPASLAAQGSPQGAGAVQAALGAAFTYQGSLRKSGQAISATCSFQFSLWDALTGGAYSLVSTIGQAEPGAAASGGSYSLTGGVWGASAAAPPPGSQRAYLPLTCGRRPQRASPDERPRRASPTTTTHQEGTRALLL